MLSFLNSSQVKSESLMPRRCLRRWASDGTLFQTADGKVTLDVRLEAVTGWLSQAQIAELTRHVVTAQGLGQPAAHRVRQARVTNK